MIPIEKIYFSCNWIQPRYFVSDKQIKYTCNNRFSLLRFIVAQDYVACVFVRHGVFDINRCLIVDKKGYTCFRFK